VDVVDALGDDGQVTVRVVQVGLGIARAGVR
jgi:hypothetical protein